MKEVKRCSKRVIKKNLLLFCARYRGQKEGGILTKLVVILSELSVADCAILVDDAADLNDTRHA